MYGFGQKHRAQSACSDVLSVKLIMSKEELLKIDELQGIVLRMSVELSRAVNGSVGVFRSNGCVILAVLSWRHHVARLTS